ncbi:MAG TPA: hypothetical protein VFF44_12460 [Casimicrobiaceae bacterium]|nr:hypothetical protein [Casimicrobiaceae bacterium]
MLGVAASDNCQPQHGDGDGTTEQIGNHGEIPPETDGAWTNLPGHIGAAPSSAAMAGCGDDRKRGGGCQTPPEATTGIETRAGSAAVRRSTRRERKRSIAGQKDRHREGTNVTQLAKSGVLIVLATSTLILAAPQARAVDLVVHSSVVLKALKAQVFKDRGRYYLQKPDRCNDPYLENPTVSFRQGRVYIGARFAGRIGGLIGGVCQSATEPGAVMLSARPVLRTQQAALEDVRIEAADKPILAAALQNLIGANSLSRLRIDLLEAVRVLTAPEKTAPYTIGVRSLKLDGLAVQNEELRVSVDGIVEIR